MAAASVELLAGAVTLLLLPTGQNVNVHWSGWEVLNHDPLVRTIVFVGPINTAGVPVSPIDELTKHSHCKRVDGRADNDLTVGPRERGSLNLLSDEQKYGFSGSFERNKIRKSKMSKAGIVRSYKLASAQ